MEIFGVSSRPPQNGVTLYQNGAVYGRSRWFLERARPKIKFGTERPGTMNDQISKNGNEWNGVVTVNFLTERPLSRDRPL